MDPSITVLLAEDNPDEAMLMTRAFKQAGLGRPPRVVPDGSDAIAYLSGAGEFRDRIAHPFPDFIILDLKMPRTTGFEVLLWMQQHPDYQVIPTIVWSSSADQRDVKRAYCLGANGYLLKPVDYQAFKAMVTDIFRFWDRCLRPLPFEGPSCTDPAPPMMSSAHR